MMAAGGAGAGMVGAGGAGAAAQVIARAIRASGAIVRVEPEDFLNILARVENPLVVIAEAGWLSKKSQYLTGYKGLAFFTQSPAPLSMPSGAELIAAKKIWIPA